MERFERFLIELMRGFSDAVLLMWYCSMMLVFRNHSEAAATIAIIVSEYMDRKDLDQIGDYYRELARNPHIRH